MLGAILCLGGILLICFIGVYFPPGLLILLAIGVIFSLSGNKKKTDPKPAPRPAAKDPVTRAYTDDQSPKTGMEEETEEAEAEEEEAGTEEEMEEDPALPLSEQKRLIDDLLAGCYDEKTGIFEGYTFDRGLEEIEKSLNDEGTAYLRKQLKAIGKDQIRRLNNVLLKPAMNSTAIRQLPGALGMASYKSMLDSIPFLCTGGKSRAGKGCPEKISAYVRTLRSIAAEETGCTPEKVEEALELTRDL